MKVVTKPENLLSGSLSSNHEPESQKEEAVECPAKGEMTLNECLGHQSRPRIAAFSNPFFSTMWKACRSGCPNSFIGPDGDPIETVDTEKHDPDKSDFLQRIEHLIETQFKGNRSAFARATGVSAGGLKRYIGGGEPTLNKLLSIAKGAKVNLLWLATGEGPKQGEPTSCALNADALARALALVEKVGAGLSPERKARLGVAVYALYIRSGAAVDAAAVEDVVRSALGDFSQTM